MKRIVGICLGLALLASCTQHDELLDSGLIRLGVKAGAYSRAADATTEGLAAVGKNIGIYGVVTTNPSADNLLSTEWGSSPLMNNVRTTSVDETTGAITWADAYSYPQEPEKYVKFCAYHPYASTDNQGGSYMEMPSGRAPVLHFVLTGSEDVMYAKPVIGSREQIPDALVFSHVLTQLRFVLEDKDGALNGKQVKSIEMSGVNTTCTMNVETGELGEWGTPASSLLVQNTNITVGDELENKVMLQPGLSELKLAVTTDNGKYSNVIIKPTTDPVFKAGKSYLVTLSFRDKTVIGVRVVVQPWIMGGYGTGIVQ